MAVFPVATKKLWHSNDKWNRMGNPRWNSTIPRKRMWACQSTYFTIFIA